MGIRSRRSRSRMVGVMLMARMRTYNERNVKWGAASCGAARVFRRLRDRVPKSRLSKRGVASYDSSENGGCGCFQSIAYEDSERAPIGPKRTPAGGYKD
jgi:hypothetical protein